MTFDESAHMSHSRVQTIFQRLREVGPWLVAALVLPGGSLLVLLVWLLQRRRGKA